MSLQIVQQVRAQYPTPLGAEHASFMIRVARALGAKLFRKDSGANVLLPAPWNVRVSQDIIILGGQWVDILSDAEGEAIPQWDAHDGATGVFVDVSDGDPAPPQPDPLPEILARLSAAEAALRGLNDQQARDHDAIAELNAAVMQLQQPPKPRTVRTSRAWGHSHEVML